MHVAVYAEDEKPDLTIEGNKLVIYVHDQLAVTTLACPEVSFGVVLGPKQV